MLIVKIIHIISTLPFDVYSKAETDERVTLGLDSIRYSFKPTSPTDGAGSIGDLHGLPIMTATIKLI